jgi:hypothetical protein
MRFSISVSFHKTTTRDVDSRAKAFFNTVRNSFAILHMCCQWHRMQIACCIIGIASKIIFSINLANLSYKKQLNPLNHLVKNQGSKISLNCPFKLWNHNCYTPWHEYLKVGRILVQAYTFGNFLEPKWLWHKRVRLEPRWTWVSHQWARKRPCRTCANNVRSYF